MEARPVPFIVGVGRSGTTLLRLMLDAHPELAIPPETQFTNLAPDMDAEAFAAAVIGARRWPDFGLSAPAFRAALGQLPQFTLGDGLRCFYRLYADRMGKRRWGDKTPTYVTRMAEIGGILPEVRFIHLIRDGRDSALSYKNVWFGPAGDLESHARMWVDHIQAARLQSRQVRHYLEVRFEDLVGDPVGTLQAICAFIELPYDPQMMRYSATATRRLDELQARPTPEGEFYIRKEDWQRIFARTSLPPDQSRIGVWRQEMMPAERAAYERIAGPLLHELGYEV